MATHAEKDYFHLNVSIRKALKGLETPLKSKHARSVIIIIHRSKESLTFWSLITRQPIMESRFTAWHFCHLLHKVLREAHRCVLQQSQKHKKMILEIGKSWGHLQDDIGNCIKAYSKLLVTKLNFHDKNRFYPGNLIITFASIANAADNDLNYYFQLCVEIFDYLDDIVLLQIAIFTSINTYRISSMTQPGQCRLAPMITLIQDSNPLYDMSVRLMFKLHEKLPNDVLSGHRERFSGIFAKLKLFYDNVRPLQYFHDLITVPQLPEHSPNFQSQVDFGSYVPPVVLVQSEPDPVVEDLVDTNSPNNSDHIQQDHILNERVNELENLLEDKSDMIDQLNAKICEWKSNFDGLEQSYKHDVLELQRSNTALSNDLASSKEIIANIRMEKDDLELQLTNNPILIQKVVEEEEKQKLSSEKFNKLKLMYTQIRDEHINLLRQHGEHSKSLNKEKQVNSELQLQIKELNNEIVKVNSAIESDKDNSSKLTQEIEELKSLNSRLEKSASEKEMKYEARIQEKENENLGLYSKVNILSEDSMELDKIKLVLKEREQKLAEAESLLKIKNEEIVETHKKNEEKYLQLSNENKQLQETLQSDAQNLRSVLVETEVKLGQRDDDLQQAESSLNLLNEEKVVLRQLSADLQQKQKELEDDLLQAINKTETLTTFNKQCEEKYLQLSNEHKQLQETLQNETQALRTVFDESQAKLKEREMVLQEAEASLILLNEEKLVSEKLFLDMQQNQKQLEGDLLEALNRVESLTKSNKQSEDKFETMRKLTIQTVKETCASTLNDGDQQALEVVPKLSAEIDTLLNKLKSSSHIPIDDCIEKIHDILYLGYYFIELYEQCDIIYITTKEIEKGLDVFNKIRSIWPDLIQLFEIIENNDNKQQFANVANGTQSKLTELNALVQGILNNFENSVDLDKLIEIELKEMDAAIEEAASKLIDLLSKSRENDNKIKLEVNEKILEACTALMENIKILNIKSRTLQKEIVSSQKGNATANEFYKRNSQWSDGLISASKSVAKAANCLVEAANNAVNSDSGQNFDLIVAAQEISACTVQLVMASKVKANRNSENLTNLTNASRNVTKATGVVVATVKDGNSRQEQQNDIDLYKLTPSQLKTMEMEIQVKVLELEQALQSQRIKLSSFRKEHYQKTEY
ncbi:huntingtin-interacting protein 1 [Drosophila grimshawi]|uniref:huntingtin-interacting protein 1 n=1 Tax=Drosophila grimshawi TaxID=7222 RepID=UPI0013EF52E4|nr:huntingtin-interacting protein 1 [Drosophila grimshawi]